MRGDNVYASISAPHGESFGWGHPRCIDSLLPCRARRSEDVHKCKVKLCASYESTARHAMRACDCQAQSLCLRVDISVATACLTGPSCATTSRTMSLNVRTAGDDVVGSAGDRCVAGGEGCPMAGSTADRYRCRSGATRSTSLFSMTLLPSGVDPDSISIEGRKWPIWPPWVAVSRWRGKATIGAPSVQNLCTIKTKTEDTNHQNTRKRNQFLDLFHNER